MSEYDCEWMRGCLRMGAWVHRSLGGLSEWLRFQIPAPLLHPTTPFVLDDDDDDDDDNDHD